MAGALDETNFRSGPQRAKRMRGRGWTEQVVAALHDDPQYPFELAGFRQKPIWSHEAIVLEIMRFHERRGRQRTCRVQRIRIEPDTPGCMFRKYPFGIMPGAGGRTMHRRIGIENAAPVSIERLRALLRRQQLEKIFAKVGIEARQGIKECALQLTPGAEKRRAQDDAADAVGMRLRI